MARDADRFTHHTGETIPRADFDDGAGVAAMAEADDLDYIRDDSPERDETAEDDSPQFRRAQRRVPVRKAPVTRKTASRLKLAFFLTLAASGAMAGYLGLEYYATHSWRFRIESGDNIETIGMHNVTRAQLMDILGADIGRNIFKVPLDDRRRQLEAIPWVERATVMRLLPDHLRVQIVERTPVAFAQIGPRIELIDINGVLMDLPLHSRGVYSFPVITGMQESEPLSTRAARMEIYERLIKEIDSSGANYSRDLSEVELSDPDDVKVTVEDAGGALVVHLGSSNFLERYKTYVAHIQEWRQQFSKLDSVDLRYRGQIIVNPDEPAPRPSVHKAR